jgi:hypothetical protein
MAKSKEKKSHKHGGPPPPPPPPPPQKVVKKKSGCIWGLLLLIIIIALALYLMKHFSFGLFGDGKNGGTGSSSVSDSSNDSSEPEEDVIIDISVLGNQYIYDNGKIELDDFVAELKEMKGNVSVRITDDNAYQDTMQELMDALEKAQIPYAAPSEKVR